MNRTAMQKTNGDGFPKAAEVIEITGAHELEAMDRAALNILYQNAHDSGRWLILMPSLRSSSCGCGPQNTKATTACVTPSSGSCGWSSPSPTPAHQQTEYPDGEPRMILTPLFAFFDLSENETPPATVRYGLPKKLQPIIARSGRWGRIKAEVVCAMTSKYAIALYELVQLRANLQRCVETFPIDRFRELMGVPPGKLTRGPDFVRCVLEMAALEVNGLSDCSVKIEPVRRNPRAPITAVTVTWWRKEGDAYRDTLRELRQPKVGRMARLKGTVERIMPGATGHIGARDRSV